ncbi:hypothetical protein GA0111570_11624 [Raineyella antarctica]|uniref:Uncharacterized protein n=1 Tax=Raineyella antarctica TaxID=1577474 RepID=A0A1G6IFK8_9ACTN|nr:hypothetical protein [Raineyella antarctica]SDC05332.1 hypothetical protein GA0111570_11624 [Raineyella antarctica]
MNTNQTPAPHTEGRHPVRTLPVLSRLAALWSAVVAALALWWLLDPGAYPLSGNGGVNGLTALLPARLVTITLGALALAGLLVAHGLGRLGPARAGRRPLLAIGSAYAVVFGLLVPDLQVLSPLGYLLALTGPVVIVALLLLGARRNPRNLLYLALVGLVVALGLAVAGTGRPVVNLLREVVAGFGRVGPRPLYLALLLAGGVLFGLLTWVVSRQGAAARTVEEEREARVRLQRWGTIATWVAAAGPVPYILVRATWLTPWPLGVPEQADQLPPTVRIMGLLLGLAAVGGSLLTIGLVARWGEVFPAWLPVIGRRPVPVMAAVVPGGLVAAVLCASSISMVMLAADSTWFLLPMIPTPVWGPALAVAVYAYYVRRTGSGVGSPVTQASPVH